MKEALHTVKSPDGRIVGELHQCEFDMCPREEFDNVGIMVCSHPCYNLGDVQTKNLFDEMAEILVTNLDDADDKDIEEIKNAMLNSHSWLKDNYEDYDNDKSFVEDYLIEAVEYDENIIGEIQSVIDRVIPVLLPLYLYDHSGLSISTSSFSCGWDSGIVGFIYATKEKVKAEWGESPDAVDKALEYLRGEVETYDTYLTGNIYDYTIYDDNDNMLDSLCGIFEYGHAVQELETAVKAMAEDTSRYVGENI